MKPDISKHFTKVLDHNRQNTYHQLSRLSDNWYLAGGTALALQMGHRVSYDFDFFSQSKISSELRRQVVEVFGNQVRFSMDTQDQLTFFTSQGVKVTFAYTPYEPVYPLINYQDITLESVADIGADKAFTIGRRGALRDYVDLYYLLKGNLSLEQIISDAQKKYQAMFEEKLFLEQLDYMDDLSDMEVVYFDDKLSLEMIEHKLHELVVSYTDNKINTANN